MGQVCVFVCVGVCAGSCKADAEQSWSKADLAQRHGVGVWVSKSRKAAELEPRSRWRFAREVKIPRVVLPSLLLYCSMSTLSKQLTKICKNCGREISKLLPSPSPSAANVSLSLAKEVGGPSLHHTLAFSPNRSQQQKNWSSIAYCSSSCRRPLGALDLAFEAGIIELLSARRRAAVVGMKKGGAALASITVEEVEEIVMARWAAEGNVEVEEPEGEDDRRSASPPASTSSVSRAPTTRSSPTHVRERARKAARRLVDRRVVEIWQKGPRGMAVVNPSFAKGTLELRGVEGQPVELVVPSLELGELVKEVEEGGKARRKR